MTSATAPSLRPVVRWLLIGCVLVVLVLAVFLWDWRTAVISLTAIPLSLVAAAVVLARFGGTLDTMVLAGLVIALGEVVDLALGGLDGVVRAPLQEDLCRAGLGVLCGPLHGFEDGLHGRRPLGAVRARQRRAGHAAGCAGLT